MAKSQRTRTTNTQEAEGQARPEKSSVQSAAIALLDKLSRQIKRRASEARKLSQRVGKQDSDYYFGMAEGLDRAYTQIRCESIRAKALQVSHEDEHAAAD